MTLLCIKLILVIFVKCTLIKSQINTNSEAKRANHFPVLLEHEKLSLISSLTNTQHFNTVLDNILVPRVVGSVGHENVKNYIIDFMQNLNWTVETDQFLDVTPNMGSLQFTNIIATLNPNAERFLIVSAHYDSKYFPNEEFLGATDSAVPVSMMLNIAYVLNSYLASNRLNNNISVKFVFFDGEEAFQEWGPNDSIYGARHLAKKWQDAGFLPKIDLFVLLDLLGCPDPNFYSFVRSGDNTERWYSHLVNSEDRLVNAGHLERYAYSSVSTNRQDNRYFQPYTINDGIEDDHIPFLRKGVPILHLIPIPFPDVWHKQSDNRDCVDIVTVENLSKIIRTFLIEYLQINM